MNPVRVSWSAFPCSVSVPLRLTAARGLTAYADAGSDRFLGRDPSGRAAQVKISGRVPSLGQHREGGSILLGSIGSTPGIELLSPIPALAQNTELGKRLSAARGLTAR